MRILVAEDEPALSAVIERYLTTQGYTVALAGNGIDALHEATFGEIDAVLLDLTMPGMDGLEVLRRLRRVDPSLPVLVLTARAHVADCVTGLDLGADDYLVKPVELDELGARLRSRLRSRDQPTATAIVVGDLRIELRARQVWRGADEIRLTAREFDLLVHLARHRGQVLGREQLLQAVWDAAYDTSTHVVDVYVGYVRRKLAVDGVPDLIETIRGVGYRLRAPR